jgi:hypothetical protein
MRGLSTYKMKMAPTPSCNALPCEFLVDTVRKRPYLRAIEGKPFHT